MKILISDTSVLLNLLAANCLASIASATGWQFAICPAVKAEVKKLRDPTSGELIAVDVTDIIESGVLQLLEMTDENEQIHYVNLASVMDDGEAMAVAIASQRGYDLAIDDKRAGNHARRTYAMLHIVSTPDILKAWFDAGAVTRGQLKNVIASIESRARYLPAKSHPLFQWWASSRDEAD